MVMQSGIQIHAITGAAGTLAHGFGSDSSCRFSTSSSTGDQVKRDECRLELDAEVAALLKLQLVR